MKKYLIGWVCCTLSAFHFNSYAADASGAEEALQVLKHHSGYFWDEQVSPILTTYQSADFDQYEGIARAQFMIDTLSMHKWGQKISETLGLFDLLFSFQSAEYQAENQQVFEQAVLTMNQFRSDVNQELVSVHPGFQLGLSSLSEQHMGKGVIIAVFDVFDTELLAKQRLHYENATIEAVQNFGDPVELNHGNSVIDIILSLAPEATIVPVASEAKTYNEAMIYIRDRNEIDVVNMSRAFAELDNALDPQFESLLLDILGTKLVVKSLGNTGTDLEGNLSPRREALGLEPVGNLFSYDLKLIQSFLANNKEKPSTHRLMFAINMETFAKDIALSATVPGNNTEASARSFAMPADSVYTWSTDNFESGSSFSAPQLTAVSALLLSAEVSEAKKVDGIVDSLKATASHATLDAKQLGNGLLNADQAYFRLFLSEK